MGQVACALPVGRVPAAMRTFKRSVSPGLANRCGWRVRSTRLLDRRECDGSRAVCALR
jgi:hypothetical protein